MSNMIEPTFWSPVGDAALRAAVGFHEGDPTADAEVIIETARKFRQFLNEDAPATH